MLWDIFCKVIDNHGDIGVCWRLSEQLARRGESIRLWVDDASALRWMAPPGHPRVEVSAWARQLSPPEPGDVVIEAFGCELEVPFQAAIAAAKRSRGVQAPWINLEYLTAERFAERNHGLPSPVLAGPAAGLTKHFFYPGFTPETGGLLREPDLLDRQARFDRDAWLRGIGLRADGARLVSLFCYEPEALGQLLAHLARGPERTRLLVAAGRPAAAVLEARRRKDRHDPGWNGSALLEVIGLPLLTQQDFDALLWACDFNFVRGEDSLVRALWAGKGFAWHVYPQHDDAHRAKLSAFLDWMKAPPALREFHSAWNGFAQELPPMAPDQWASPAQQARARLLAQDDLVTQLLRFVATRTTPAS